MLVRVGVGITVLARGLPVRLAAGYVIAQVLDGIGGGAGLGRGRQSHRLPARTSMSCVPTVGRAVQRRDDGFAVPAIVEVTGTAVLVYTVLWVTATPAVVPSAGLLIGLASLCGHVVAVPIDGTSVSPARSIGSTGNADVTDHRSPRRVALFLHRSGPAGLFCIGAVR